MRKVALSPEISPNEKPPSKPGPNTADERVEERVRAVQSALAEVEALTHIGSWKFDHTSQRLAWSDETYRIFGLDRETFIPSYAAFFERVHPDDRARVERTYQKSVADSTSFDVEHRILMDDGSIRIVRERGHTQCDLDGNPLRSVGTAQDVTEQRAAETALRASEEKYRNLVETSPDYIFEVDAGMRFTYANPATLRLLGYTAEELADKSPFNFIRDEEDARQLAQLVLKRLPISHVETTVRTPDGREAMVESSATPIFGLDGSFQGYRSIEHDITQRVQSEQVMRATLRRAHDQLAITSLISQSDALLSGDVENLAREITERGAGTVGCERVNVWLFDESETELTCIDLFEATSNRHSSGAVLHESEYGPEFRTLKAAKYVDANDPLTDPRTAGYVEAYIKPLGITSMLDVAVQASGRTFGLICFEHVGKSHIWEKDEIAFAGQLADKIALAVTNKRRIAAEQALRSSERQLSNALAIARAGGWEFDPAKNLFTFNDSFYRVFGTTAKAVGSYTMSPEAYARRFVHPDDIAVVSKEVAATITAKDPGYSREIEHRFLYANGETGYMAVRFFIIKDAEGHTIKSYGVNQDITDRKRAEMALRDSRKFIEDILNTIPARVFWKDRNLDYLGCNSSFALDSGLADPAEIVGKNDYELGWRAQADAYRDDDMQVIKSGRGKLLIEEPQTTPSGDTITLLTSKIPLRDSSGGIAGVLGMYLDITDRKRAEEALRASEAKYLDLFQSTRDAILTLDPVSIAFGSANPAAVTLFGAECEAALRSMRPWELSPERQPDGCASMEKAREMVNTAMRVGSHSFEWIHMRVDGREFPADVLLTRVMHGQNTLLYATIRDITDRKKTEAVIIQMARYDALTGLANRRVFVEELDRAMARSRRSDKGLAVLYLDLDHFKDVNDTLGHPVGDELLKAVADRLRRNMREVDTVARFGGDEFAVVMSDVADPAEAALLAEKLLKCLAEPFHIGGNEIRTGTSIGISTYGNDTPDAETILTHADVALYRAKNEGRGTFRFFTDAMDREVKTRVTLGAELRHAIAAEQFTLYYQPEVDIDTGKIIGLEALVRWKHPQRGLLGPGEFIPAAEESGLICALGRWILWDACRQAREWIELGIAPGFVAVNVSTLQFKSPQDLEKDVFDAQEEFKLPPRMLELELTETVLMDTTRRNSDILQRFRDHGVRIAIDDFGTGYSSLEYLRKLPVDRIKIAQPFVAELDNVPSSGPIVKAAIGLARALGLGVIAEGVETKAQLEVLRSWGCREAQGFYFAEPRPPQEITKLLRGKRLSSLVAP